MNYNQDEKNTIIQLHTQCVLVIELLCNHWLVDHDYKSINATKLAHDGIMIIFHLLYVYHSESHENRLFQLAEQHLIDEHHNIEATTQLWDEICSKLKQTIKWSDFTYITNASTISNAISCRILLGLGQINGFVGKKMQWDTIKINYLSAIGESIAALKPLILTVPHTWVNAHGGGIGLVSDDLLNGLNLSNAINVNKFNTMISSHRITRYPKIGQFVLSNTDAEKKSGAAFYTPSKLADFLVRRTLKPLTETTSVSDILALRIIEPSVGCGNLLFSIVNHLSIKLHALDPHTSLQDHKRSVITHCLYGVELHHIPRKIRILLLNLEGHVINKPYIELDDHIKCGNSLIGLNNNDSNDIDIFDIPIQHIKIDNKLWEYWDDYQSTYGKIPNSSHQKQIFNDKKSELKLEKEKLSTNDKWTISKRKSFNDFLQLIQEDNQRAYMRLKALGDLNTALWYWPLDQYQHYPSFAVYRELCDWLLNETTLIRGRRGKNLSAATFKVLKIALNVAKKHQFFHWQVEFAHIFADANRFGFNAVISNPPWKVVGVKDKEVFPEIDPQFMSTPPAKKAKRLQKLYELKPFAAKLWLDTFYFNSGLSNYWRWSKKSKIRPEGKVDQCVLFTLACENYVADRGRIGLIASRSSLFTNKATKNLRQHFFEKWGLEESISFINTIGIFEIDSRVEFLCLIANQGGARRSPRFVHGVTDPNDLDVIDKNIETQQLSKIMTGHRPVELTASVIEQGFSREALSIPGLKDQRQLDVARALHEASGPVVYLGQLDCSVRVGINQSAGPKKGISQFAEKIPAHELPTLADIRSGKPTKWIPLYRGRQFDLFEPLVGGFSDQNFQFNQYGLREKLVGQINFDKDTLVWRAISQKGNQRTLITSSMPKGYWCDHKAYTIQFNRNDNLWKMKFLLSGIPIDFCVRNVCSSDVTLTVVNCLPLTNYSTEFMTQGMILIKEMESGKKNLQNMAKIDALVWLHYGINHPVLNRDNLAWLVNTKFPALLRHNPGYADLVLEAYDQYQSLDPNLQPNIFSKKLEYDII